VFVVAIIVQMGHNQREMLKDYWSTLEQYFTTFYDLLWKMRAVFEKFNYSYAKY